MKLTRERALELHRQMWIDMQTDLGDTPSHLQRALYKFNWIKNHFPDESHGAPDYTYLLDDDACIPPDIDDCVPPDIIRHNCFLCEYAHAEYASCECLIKWPGVRCEDLEDTWDNMPISELLALPEKGE